MKTGQLLLIYGVTLVAITVLAEDQRAIGTPFVG